MWALEGDPWTLQRAWVPSGIMKMLEFPASGILLEVGCGEDIFSSGPARLVFFRTKVSEASDS